MKVSNFYSRRDFMKFSLTSATAFAMMGIHEGCTTLPFISDKLFPIAELKLPNIQCDKGLYLKNGKIIDVKKGVVLKGKVIKVNHSKIEQIGNEYELVNNDQYLEIDLDGSYVIPGLIDSHCHISFPCTYGFNIIDLIAYFKQVKRNYNQHIYSGITTVRDMGAFPLLLQYFNSLLPENKLIGPRVIFCNKFANVYRSHPDIAPPDLTKWALLDDIIVGDQSIWFHDMDGLMKGLEWNIANNASFVKITLDDLSLMCGGGKIPIYKEEHLKAIFNFAQTHNLPVAGHALRQFGFDRALHWDIHSLEHTIGDGYHTDEEIERMANKNVSINPTLIIGQMYAVEEAYDYIPKEYRNDFIDDILVSRRDFIYTPQDKYIDRKIHENNRKMLDYYKQYGCENLYQKNVFVADPNLFFGVLKYAPENLRKMREAGINIGCGTDAGMPYILHGLLWKEMELMSKAGFSNMEVLQCATINNSKILNMEDEIGSIEKGKLADITILTNNPLTSISSYRNPCMVIKDGQIVFVSNKLSRGVNTIKMKRA